MFITQARFHRKQSGYSFIVFPILVLQTCSVRFPFPDPRQYLEETVGLIQLLFTFVTVLFQGIFQVQSPLNVQT